MQYEEKTYKIYVDLDGVLCDFNNRFKKFVGIKPKKFEKEHGIKKFWEEIQKENVEYWSKMSWMSDGKKLWQFIINNFDDVEILTGSPWGKVGQFAQQGKNEWCKRELGDIKVNHKSSKQKYKFADEYHILIDDTKRNTDMWRDANGIEILHKSSKDTIKKLKKFLN